MRRWQSLPGTLRSLPFTHFPIFLFLAFFHLSSLFIAHILPFLNAFTSLNPYFLLLFCGVFQHELTTGLIWLLLYLKTQGLLKLGFLVFLSFSGFSGQGFLVNFRCYFIRVKSFLSLILYGISFFLLRWLTSTFLSVFRFPCFLQWIFQCGLLINLLFLRTFLFRFSWLTVLINVLFFYTDTSFGVYGCFFIPAAFRHIFRPSQEFALPGS